MGKPQGKARRDASARVAFAALLHDLGKFAERGRVGADDPRLPVHRQIYCPQPAGSGAKGYFTHAHAAFTALAFDRLEEHLPSLIEQAFPFQCRRRVGGVSGTDAGEPDDSLVNAAAGHHKPVTFLQWMIACGDRIASGFERRAWEEYNSAGEREGRSNHYRTRLVSLFGEIGLLHDDLGEKKRDMRHLLRRAGPELLAPVEKGQAEPDGEKAAQQEYRRLWEEFLAELKKIPMPHRSDWALWLDHFDTLWFQFTHAIPSATAGNTKPDVSLYDHSRTTAALATALWRYHHDRGDDEQAVAGRQKGRSDWDEPKFLLVQGDLFGIQRFIFAGGGESNRGAAKILRGRSAHISLLAECAALELLEALDLPPTSQVINAAGKFLIVAPNTEEARNTVKAVQREIDAWFLKYSFGEAGLGIATREACPNDFVEGSRFKDIQQKLVNDLDHVKHQRFGLCAGNAPKAVFEEANYRHRECRFQGRWPAQVGMDGRDDEPTINRLTADQLTIGRVLAQKKTLRLRIWRKNEADEGGRREQEMLLVPLFGYRLGFVPLGQEEKDRCDAPGPLPARVWDLSLPASGDAAPWHGLAWRAINAYVPVHGGPDDAERKELYAAAGLKPDEVGDPDGGVRSFHELAGEALELAEDDAGSGMRGVPALMVAKGDIDDLGRLFERGLADPSFAKWAALSRQVNAFFTLRVPWLLAERFPQIYTVFAGGDDFFFIGPWRRMLPFVQTLHDEFAHHVGGNRGIHFSLGVVMVKPQVPVSSMARMAEDALKEAKHHGTDGSGTPAKNAVTCFGETVKWGDGSQALDFSRLEARYRELKKLADDFPVITSSGFLYDVLHFVEMRARETLDPRQTLWRALLRYRTRRQIVDRLPHDMRKEHGDRIHEEIVTEIGEDGIERAGAAYRIPLYRFLYERRGYRRGDKR